jgi:hypothetical protein
MASSITTDTVTARQEAPVLLFEYTLKALVVAGLCELILYRLVSRLGMHLSKVAKEYIVVEYFLRGVSSLGFALLNVSAILVFLALFTFMFTKMYQRRPLSLDSLVNVLVSLLVGLTVTYLLFPPVVLGAIAYSVLTVLAIWAIIVQYYMSHPLWTSRAMILCYGCGISGWLYYHITTTTYGWLTLTTTPPLVNEANRVGEALMVLAAVLVLVAYGGVTFHTKNRRQQRRLVMYGTMSGLVFLGLLFMDSLLELINPETAGAVRQGSQGIGWIFQMGMGYTFYLPFALYMAGLLCWAYAVSRQITMGRRAGYGLILMFIAGYALQLSHLTLFVVLGLLVVTNDGRIEARMEADQPFSPGLGDRPAIEPSGAS